VFYADKRLEVGQILRKLCEWKKVNIIEAELCPDHMHMLVEISPKTAVSSFMGEQPNDIREVGEHEIQVQGVLVLWILCRYGSKKISEYTGSQLKEERLGDMLAFSENPFVKPESRMRQAVKTLFNRS
jgi:putative transposase